MKMDDTERKDIAEFISGVRESEPKSWWVGIYDPNTESPELISTSLRGFFQESYWKPIDDEYAGECCDAVHDEIKKGETEDAFHWMEHCVSEDHIDAMLAKRTPEQLDAEYQYMLEQTLAALEENL
jgi:hypothetical protein